MTFATVRLEDVCDISIGKTPPRDQSHYWGEGHRWLSIADMSQGRDLLHTKESITQAAIDDGVSGRLVQPGTVLMSFKLSIGKLGIVRTPLYTNEAIAALGIQDTQRLLPDYLYHALGALNLTAAGDRAVMGMTLNKRKLRDIKIPLPPLPEQRRIAAILDKADAVRRKRQQTLDLADQFLRSAFLEMFGDPVTNPNGWPVKKLGEVLIDIEGGWSANGESRIPEPGEKAVLKISAVTSGMYKPEECKVVADLKGRNIILPELGDVLFSRANTRELVAATCLVDRMAPDVFLPDKLWRLVPDTNEILGPYLRFVLSTDSLRALIRRRATGTSGSMLNVSMAKLRGIPIPLPNLAQQRRFGEVLARQQLLTHSTQDAASKCESLASALTQRAFRGKH